MLINSGNSVLDAIARAESLENFLNKIIPTIRVTQPVTSDEGINIVPIPSFLTLVFRHSFLISILRCVYFMYDFNADHISKFSLTCAFSCSCALLKFHTYRSFCKYVLFYESFNFYIMIYSYVFIVSLNCNIHVLRFVEIISFILRVDLFTTRYICLCTYTTYITHLLLSVPKILSSSFIPVSPNTQRTASMLRVHTKSLFADIV